MSTKDNSLDLVTKLTDESGMAKANAEKLLEEYGVPFTEAGEILATYRNIKVADESDVSTMALARGTRLKLRDTRIAIEKKHDELKADSLRTGRAIDLVQRVALAEIKPAEEYLKLQEDYAETQQKLRREQRIADRKEKLALYVDDTSIYNFGDMADDQFDQLLNDAKTAKEARDKAEADRIKAEKAAEAKAEKERKAKEEADRKARVEAERKLEAERKENRKIYARINELIALGATPDGNDGYVIDGSTITGLEVHTDTDDDWTKKMDNLRGQLAAKKLAAEKRQQEQDEADNKERQRVAALEAEAKRIADEKKAQEDAAKQAAAAPDKEKLTQYVESLEFNILPALTTEKGIAVAKRIQIHITASMETYRELIEKEL